MFGIHTAPQSVVRDAWGGVLSELFFVNREGGALPGRHGQKLKATGSQTFESCVEALVGVGERVCVSGASFRRFERSAHATSGDLVSIKRNRHRQAASLPGD